MKNFFRRIYKLPLYIYCRMLVEIKLIDKLKSRAFNLLRWDYENIYLKLNHNKILNRKSEGYHWDSWSGKIRSKFRKKVPLNFLSEPLIAFTMVLGGTSWSPNLAKERILASKQIFKEDELRRLLLEDNIGIPILSNLEYLTSANRAHHVSHLAYYLKMTGEKLWENNTILEWGGGYGSMARLVRKMNKDATYIISDLPELLALQYIYLGSTEHSDCLNLVSSNMDKIVPGKINLVPSELLLSGGFNINCDIFISTWALTECPKFIQEFIYNKKFFQAKTVFIASLIDANNWLNAEIKKGKDVKLMPVPFFVEPHEYWIIKHNQ